MDLPPTNELQATNNRFLYNLVHICDKYSEPSTSNLELDLDTGTVVQVLQPGEKPLTTAEAKAKLKKCDLTGNSCFSSPFVDGMTSSAISRQRVLKHNRRFERVFNNPRGMAQLARNFDAPEFDDVFDYEASNGLSSQADENAIPQELFDFALSDDDSDEEEAGEAEESDDEDGDDIDSEESVEIPTGTQTMGAEEISEEPDAADVFLDDTSVPVEYDAPKKEPEVSTLRRSTRKSIPPQRLINEMQPEKKKKKAARKSEPLPAATAPVAVPKKGRKSAPAAVPTSRRSAAPAEETSDNEDPNEVLAPAAGTRKRSRARKNDAVQPKKQRI